MLSNTQKPSQEVVKGLVSKFKMWSFLVVLIVNVVHADGFVEGKFVSKTEKGTKHRIKVNELLVHAVCWWQM